MANLQTFIILIYFLLPFTYARNRTAASLNYIENSKTWPYKHLTLKDIESSPSWSYDNTEAWGNDYPQCNGRLQSPINLIRNMANVWFLPPIRFGNYNVPLAENASLHNNGKTVEFEVPETINGFSPSVTGGLMTSIYEAENVHFHWGSDGNKGSEHAINGQRYDVEMHIVHRNSNYETVEDALENKDGLAVLGIFFEIVDEPVKVYPGLDKIFNILPQVEQYDTRANISSPFKLEHVLGDLNTNKFYTYRGSLTTPPCAEVVTWTVFPEPLPIASEQIMKFFNLRDANGNPLVNNYRPLQPRNNRPVFYRYVAQI